jgi:hypothetical protein
VKRLLQQAKNINHNYLQLKCSQKCLCIRTNKVRGDERLLRRE